MYNKSQLVSFGNHLFKTYGVQVHSTDGKNQPIYQREVSDADLANWKEEAPEKPITPTYNLKFKPRDQWHQAKSGPLPSRFQNGDPVVVYLGTAGIIQNCVVIKVHFTESKVLYDVEVRWQHLESADNVSAGVDKERYLFDRLYNLDSAVVFSPYDFE